ncbi:MAG: zinc ribbon domain-containing protein [Chloroflexota bacterium]
MAIACANCGTQNPDGNKFCQSCGKPLTAAPVGAAAAATPPPAAAPMAAAPMAPAPAPAGAPPPGYQSPYYAPVPGQGVAVHRTSPGLIIGIVGGLILLMVAAMFLIGLIFLRPQPKPAAALHPSGNTTPVPSTPTPQPSNSGNPTSAPTATPTSRPTATPTPAPTASTGGGTIKTNSFQVRAPGWKILKQDSISVTLLTPSQDGTVFIAGGQLKTATDTQTWVAGFMSDINKKFPDAKVCVKPTAVTQGGKDGIIVGMCYTATPSSGAAFTAADVFWASVDSSNNVFEFEIFSDVKNFDNVFKQAEPVLADDSLKWAA